MKAAKFAMAFHCYQPVFNFDGEIEYAYKNAYSPLIEVLGSFPGVKASFHFSGNLLEWFESRHPEYIDKIKELIRRDQIEILGGGCFEPVMAIIPERDRVEQLKMNEELISRIFGIRSNGVWLAERVWEPELVDTLARAGVKYTIVDDYHMCKAGLGKEIFKPCRTRGKTGQVTLFPSLTHLRYSMPFRPPEVTIEYMKKASCDSEQETTCFFFADDGEKFGSWPHTYKWVHEKGWLKDFFALLQDNASWLETVRYSDVLDGVPCEEVGQVPSASYAEMMEWSGGDFKNFLKKYPEADRMHKRMLAVSDSIDRIGTGSSGIKDAKIELFKAQSNCAYWHGTFGGLYLPHLRTGVYKHLIKAQNIIDGLKEGHARRIRAVERDLGDGNRETVIQSRLLEVFVRPKEGGVVNELDHKPSNINLTNSMTRSKEKYHEKLKRGFSSRIRRARQAVARGDLADIHDVLGIGEKGLKRHLVYDDYQRASFRTHVLRDRGLWQQMRTGYGSCDSFLKGDYASRTISNGEFITQELTRRDKVFLDNGRPFDLEVIKRITLGDGPAVMFSNKVMKHSGGHILLKCAVEFNFLIWDKAVIKRPRVLRTDSFSIKDMYSGAVLDFFLDRRYKVFMYPVYTVNETELGLKKTFQGVSAFIGSESSFADLSGSDEMKITIAIG
ncbi:MAG: alpha-amylase/4-alpha-glucanotransferase domain-containing protein [Candidatus Omnitrophota bacterium]